MRRFLLGAMAVSLSAFSFGAGPTTRPTVKHPIPSSWQTFNNKTYHFKYRIPTLWKASQQSDQQTRFKIPAGQNSHGFFGVFATSCHAAKLEDDVIDQRKSLLASEKDAKLVRDEATMLGQKPGWIFTTEHTNVMKEFRRSGNNPPVEIDHKFKEYHTMVFTVEGSTHFIVDFMGDATLYQSTATQVQMITDSFDFATATASIN